ncbi:MAG TPA: hypothetical protein VM143_12810 [Acidimicrobiales bacterium]|nr:hypothetical protein [Acidimicrobiales bacterium]
MNDVRRLDDRERQIGFVLAAIAVVGFIALDQRAPVRLAIGLAMAAAVAAGTARRSRVLVAVASFVTTFGPWSYLVIAGAPYAVYALWLLSGATRADRKKDNSSDRRRTRDRSVGS